MSSVYILIHCGISKITSTVCVHSSIHTYTWYALTHIHSHTEQKKRTANVLSAFAFYTFSVCRALAAFYICFSRVLVVTANECACHQTNSKMAASENSCFSSYPSSISLLWHFRRLPLLLLWKLMLFRIVKFLLLSMHGSQLHGFSHRISNYLIMCWCMCKRASA